VPTQQPAQTDSLTLGGDLRGRVLTGAALQGLDLRQADLILADLSGADLRQAQLSAAVAHRARLRGANLQNAQLADLVARDVDFEGADLSGANLRNATLTNAILLDANLAGADLRGADLRGADLRNANLEHACLIGACLDFADLGGVQIAGAQLEGVTARGARIDAFSSEANASLTLLGAAGARTRLPMAPGRLAATLSLLSYTFLSEAIGVFKHAFTRTAPVRDWFQPKIQASIRWLGPLGRGTWALATQASSLAVAGAQWCGERARSTAAQAQNLTRASWGQLRRGSSMASQVRREGVERLQRLGEERVRRERHRSERRAKVRSQRAQRAQAKIPGGPGADMQGQDFHGRRLAFALWAHADLRAARLDGALLDKADLRGAKLNQARLIGTRLREADLGQADLSDALLEGARLRGAILAGATATNTRLVDADLRRTDLRGADLSHANLSGADLRGARLQNANLHGANLTGARLPDVDLMDANLDGAILEQADLAGVRWAGVSVSGTDLSGALGLSGAQREQLRAWGAQVEDVRFERFLGQIGSRPAQAAAALLAIGMTTYLAARFATSDVIDPARLEVEAQDLRGADPAQASQAYAELSALARRPEDKVGYLVEAAGLADSAGDTDAAESWLREALAEAENTENLHAETKLHLATFLHEHQRFTDALEEVEPLIQLSEQQPGQRARALMLYEGVRADLGLTDDDAREAVFSAMGDIPETQAELRLALAELFANRGDTTAAIEQVDATSLLDLPIDIQLRVLATRARIFDRSGDLDRAISTWESVHKQAPERSLADQAARLATADLHLRQGRIAVALSTIEPLLLTISDERIRGRALIVSGRIHEKRGDLEAAVSNYRMVLNIERLDMNTTEEARIALASLVLDEHGVEAAEALLADMPPGAATEVMANARLGEARRHLDAGDAVAAHRILERLIEVEGISRATDRAAHAGLGEALAQMGELQDALEIWRELLGQKNTVDERIQLELLLANGLLQGGKRKESATAFRSLADSKNDDARIQGVLGLAEVAQASGENQRARALYRQVADNLNANTWRVRALAELAELASSDGDRKDGVALWRELLTSLPPGHPSAPDTRLSLVAALLSIGNLDDALHICSQAIDAAPTPSHVRSARVACGEVQERAGRWAEAQRTYSDVLLDPLTPEDVIVDAALGAARTGLAARSPQAAVDAIGQALSRTDNPSHRLPLLAMRIQALRNMDNEVELQSALIERDALAAQAPQIAWKAFLESAGQARSRADPTTAEALLVKALDLPIATEQRAQLLVELASALLDQGRINEATERFEQVVALANDDPMLLFQTGMGQAEILRRMGRPSAAATRLKQLTPPDAEERLAWLNSIATALSEAEDPEAEDYWERLAESGQANAETRFSALRGQADALLARDQPAEALPLYREAERIAPEPWAQGWAALGVAAAQAMLGEIDEANQALDLLREHPDPEVRIQAVIRRADAAANAENWAVAIRLVQPEAAAALGPAWDASATATRARSLVGAGDHDGAEATWHALANRWPEEEEGFLPAWLGLAQLAHHAGDEVNAHRWARKAYRNAIDPGYRAQAEALMEVFGGG
jgi:uncharacterized protein YjbI with pentapeptide repeats/tetratricopeptide (TPR) repeat protein